MRKILLVGLSAVGLLCAAFNSSAEDAKTVTITGQGKCAKCALKETDSCQNAIETKVDGKKVVYYLTKNEVSDEFHRNICRKPAKVKATGTVKEVDGKKEFTATKIVVVK